MPITHRSAIYARCVFGSVWAYIVSGSFSKKSEFEKKTRIKNNVFSSPRPWCAVRVCTTGTAHSYCSIARCWCGSTAEDKAPAAPEAPAAAAAAAAAAAPLPFPSFLSFFFFSSSSFPSPFGCCSRASRWPR